MQERPTLIEPRILQRLFALRTQLQGQLAEVDMEIQRVQMGQRPHNLKPVLEQQPRDRFWLQTVDFNQTRAEQASQQYDQKQMMTPPYESLLQ